MSAHSNNNNSLHQVYQDLMASMTPEDSSHQLQAQDCNTTVAGSEHDTATQAEEEDKSAPICLSHLGFEDLRDWSNNIVLKTSSSPLATPSALLHARCNSKDLFSVYPVIINWFVRSHHEEMLYVYVQALFAEDNAVIRSAFWESFKYGIRKEEKLI
ncbi:hypothetical protein DSO57_1024177 [Entomophthora muscae]|uniref:Uncharacterized protein n=1 Tax=Entomophthora muscae TaxID=34485 RepID=A0ACC2S4Q0_9FUNG|nr:hypothetical protein DSO57_1024177 [Entomophthora muscae]